jgi:hypothetical protein
VKITNSEAHTFLRCQRKWNFSSHNRQNLRRVAAPKSTLNVGSLVHHGLELALNGIRHPWDEVAKLAQRQAKEGEQKSIEVTGVGWLQEELDRLQEDQDLAVALVRNYCDYWSFMGGGKTSVDPYEVVATEITFQVPIPGTSHFYAGTFDALLKDPLDRIWVMDHKTYSREPRKEKNELDWQFRSYGWVASQLFPGSEIGGTIYNGLKKTIPKKPTPLKSGKISKAKTALSTTTFIQYAAAIQEARLDPGDYQEEITYLIQRDKNDNPFFRRYEIPRSRHTEQSWLEAFANLSRQMEAPEPLVPHFDWRGCSDCSFKSLCNAQERAEALPLDQYEINTSYQTAQNLNLDAETVTSIEDLL